MVEYFQAPILHCGRNQKLEVSLRPLLKNLIWRYNDAEKVREITKILCPLTQ